MPSLPNDVISMICWHLHPYSLSDGYVTIRMPRDLLNMMLASRSFYHAARPVLYHIVEADGETYTARLLRTFVDRPDCTSFVRKFLLATGYEEGSLAGLAGTLPEQDLGRVVAKVEGLRIPSELREELRAGLEGGQATQDAGVGLMLCLLAPHLHTVDLTSHYFPEKGFVHGFARKLLCNLFPTDGSAQEEGAGMFRKVKAFNLRHADTEGATHFVEHLDWLRLPALETLRAVQVDFVSDPDGARTDLDLPVTKLRKLDLNQCLVDHDSLHALLAACPELEELRVDWGSATVGYYDVRVDCERVGDALRRHGLGLRVLHLYTWGLMDIDWEEGKEIGSLTGLTKLRDLHVSWDVVFGPEDSESPIDRNHLANTLPSTLETLEMSMIRIDSAVWVENIHDKLDAQFQALMESEKFDALRLIRVERGNPYSLSPPSTWHASFEKVPQSMDMMVLLTKIDGLTVLNDTQ